MVGEVICSVKNDDEQLVPNLGVDVRIRLQARAAGAARASAGSVAAIKAAGTCSW